MATIRESVNPAALVDWYRLLWHVDKNGEGRLTETLDLAKLERELYLLLHYHRRDDLAIMVCVMRVWSLARMCNCRAASDEPFSFHDIERYVLPKTAVDTSLRRLENAIALLCGKPVEDRLIPPLYRQTPPLGMPGFELTDEGVLILFSHWHGHLLHVFLMVECSRPSVEDSFACATFAANDAPYNFGDDDFRLLDRILGMENVSMLAIFSFYSNPNPFTLIKHSGVDSTNQTKMAGTLFDHEPMLYKESEIGRLLVLARGYKLPFLVNDEIMFYCHGDPKHAIGLVYSLERKCCVLVLNGRVAALFELGVESAVHLLESAIRHSGLTANSEQRSTGPEGAMEEET